jgi:hypothetical protein
VRATAKENPVNPIVITTVAVVSSHVTALAGLRLRLSWRVRHEQARGACLAVVAERLPAGGRLCDVRPDGTCLTLTVAAPHCEEYGHGS